MRNEWVIIAVYPQSDLYPHGGAHKVYGPFASRDEAIAFGRAFNDVSGRKTILGALQGRPGRPYGMDGLRAWFRRRRGDWSDATREGRATAH
jgi:hypothetical protein